MVVEAIELIVRKRHDPYPGVRLFANQRVAIAHPAFAEALLRRCFFEKVADDVLQKEEAEAEELEKPKKKGK
jgi:hypothetical protein